MLNGRCLTGNSSDGSSIFKIPRVIERPKIKILSLS